MRTLVPNIVGWRIIILPALFGNQSSCSCHPNASPWRSDPLDQWHQSRTNEHIYTCSTMNTDNLINNEHRTPDHQCHNEPQLCECCWAEIDGGGEAGWWINFKIPLQTHHKYYITQYEELGFSLLARVKDHDYTTNLTTSLIFNPFTPESDQCQNSPAASQEIWHHTVWRTWLFIAYSDEKWLYYKFSLHHSYNRFLNGWENTLFELRS